MNNMLHDWACSFSGCDGGNPDSKIWLCGIESGYKGFTDLERKDYYQNVLPQEIRNGKQELKTNYRFFTDENMNIPFNLAFAKIYSAIVGKDLACINDTILKLNLSPIAFTRDDEGLWNENLIKSTGFKSKSIFTQYIEGLNRFEKITNLYRPMLIVCIGNGYKDHFSKCFFGQANVQKFKSITIRPEAENKNQNNRYIYHKALDSTQLVVTPFSTSSNGLNSDHLLMEAGKLMRSLL